MAEIYKALKKDMAAFNTQAQAKDLPPASTCSADDAAEYKQLCQLALMTCDDIYNDYTSESINDQPLSIRVAWSWGHKNRQRKLKKQNQGEQP